jgi:hypothetical protein
MERGSRPQPVAAGVCQSVTVGANLDPFKDCMKRCISKKLNF